MRSRTSARGLCLGAQVAAAVVIAGRAGVAAAEPPSPRERPVAAPSTTGREESDRAFLVGDAPGALASPVWLRDEATTATVCAALQGTRGARVEGDAFAPPTRRALRERQRLARRKVYAVQIDPGGFRVGPYRPERSALALPVDRGFVALDGAVVLQVMRAQGAEFTAAPADARAIARGVGAKTLALRVVFRLDADDEEELSPCFSPAGSASYVLRAVPLSYELVEATSARRVARATTRALRALERFARPGPAALRTEVEVAPGQDAAPLSTALAVARDALSACLDPVLRSRGDTGVLGLSLTVLPSGAVADVRLEVEALEPPSASACVASLIQGLECSRSKRATRAYLTVAVDRPSLDEQPSADPR